MKDDRMLQRKTTGRKSLGARRLVHVAVGLTGDFLLGLLPVACAIVTCSALADWIRVGAAMVAEILTLSLMAGLSLAGMTVRGSFYVALFLSCIIPYATVMAHGASWPLAVICSVWAWIVVRAYLLARMEPATR